MSQTSPAADALQWQMRQVRSEIDTDVDDLVSDAQSIAGQARELFDWKHHVRRNPWTTMAVAAAAGFWLVPRRPKVVQADARELARLVKSQDLVLNVAPPATTARRAALGGAAGILAPVVNMAAGMALQKGFSLLERQLAHFLQPQSAATTSTGPATHNGHD